jgi:hypothetical protein
VKWQPMRRGELIAWGVFFFAQPAPVVFWLAEVLQDTGEATGRLWLPWVVAVVDALGMGVAAWRFHVTRHPPDPSGRYARRHQS